MGKVAFSQLKLKKIAGKNEFIDLLVHLSELEVLNYLPSFLYRTKDCSPKSAGTSRAVKDNDLIFKF